MTSTFRRRNNSSFEKEIDRTSSKYEASVLARTSLEMTCRDRTHEFLSVVRNKEGRATDSTRFAAKKTRYIKGAESFSNFMQIATQIGKDINHTFTKLEKLTLLVKKKSLFDDKPVEIQELTYIIKQDINSLNKQIAQLQTSKASSSQHGKHMVTHSNTVVVSLQSKLANMSNDFRHVLEMRTENLKHEKQRRDHFSEGKMSAPFSLPSAAVSERTGSVLLTDELANTQMKGDFMIDMNQMQYQQQVQLIDQQDSYLQERTDAMQNIEATIVELGTIFQQLAHMVKEQEEVLTRIDSNVEESQLNIEAAHSEILKYFQSVTSNRWLMIKIFAVLIIFFIIFVVLVA